MQPIEGLNSSSEHPISQYSFLCMAIFIFQAVEDRADHQYLKRRVYIQDSYKLGCQAKAVITKQVVFPDFKIKVSLTIPEMTTPVLL